MSRDSGVAGFGANEWMVEEMRDAWRSDPASVGPRWRSLFEAEATAPAVIAAAESSDAGSTATGPTASQSVAAGPAESPDPEDPAPAPPSNTAPRPRPAQDSAGPGAAPHRQILSIQDVTRSDLPPAPPSGTAPPTSPYAQRLARQHRRNGGAGEDSSVRLRGAAARTAKNMEASLSVPTATSARAVPAKVLIENRAIINGHLAHTRGGRVSFTHLIGWAVVESLSEMPSMNVSYAVDDASGPVLREPAHIALGLAVDVPGPDGERRLLVPSVKRADLMDLAGFVAACEDLVRRAREGGLGVDDFRGTTVTLTNPGMFGTLHSVPRLMPGQGLIVGEIGRAHV